MQNNGLHGYDYEFRAISLHTFGVWVVRTGSMMRFFFRPVRSSELRVRAQEAGLLLLNLIYWGNPIGFRV